MGEGAAMGGLIYLPEALEALLGVVLAGGGELDPLPEQSRGVVPLHHLQRPRRPERAGAAEHAASRHRPRRPARSSVFLLSGGGGRRLGERSVERGEGRGEGFGTCFGFWASGPVGPVSITAELSLARCQWDLRCLNEENYK